LRSLREALAKKPVMRRKTIGAAAEDLGSKGFVNRFSIGRRLTLCFVGIFVLLLAVNGILLWQFHSAQVIADRRLTGVSVELIAVLNLQSSLQSFNDRLDKVAQSQNAVILRQGSGPLRDMILESVQDARNAISHLPPEVRPYPTLIPTIEAIESTLPLQLESLNSLAASGDWSALRLRLANEKQPLDEQTSMLVKSITRELNDELGQTVTNIARLQRQMVIVLPLTALGTLLIASLLGLMITRSITTPLGKLMKGSSALSRGEFDHVVPISGDDELARLGRVFNDMAGKLRSVYETLQDSNAKLEEAQRITHVGYWEWDLGTNRVKWSDETYRIYGMQPQECPMDLATLREKIPPEDWERAMAVARGGSARFSIEYRVLRPTGEVRIVHTRGEVKKDASGRPYQMFGTVQDITDSKRAEDALRKSEKELRDVIDTIPAIVWSALPDGSNAYINRRFMEYSGLAAEQTVGSGWQAAVHPDDLERHAGKWMEAVATGKPHENEVRFRRSDGQYRCHLDRGVPLRDENGNIVKWYGVVTDIEDLKRAKEALESMSRDLQESKTRLEVAQLIAHVGHWSWDGKDGLTWSDETYRIYGLRPQERPMTVEAFQEMIHPEDREILFRAIHEARGGGLPDIEYRIIHPSGEVRIVHAVTKDMSGQPYQMFGIVQDITDRKRAEERLRESEAYLAEAQRLTHTGSWANTATGEPRYWSEECYRVLGFDPAEPLPSLETIFQRIHPDDRATARDQLDRGIRDKADFAVDMRIVHPITGIRNIRSTGHMVLDRSGDIVELVGTVIDITERKSAEQEREKLRQLEADLAHINRVSTLGEMAASLAHEIKQPIAAAITSANTCIEWLAHEPPNLDRARAAAARIDKYGNRAADIIDRIRSLYRKSPPQRELVDVNGMIHEMLTLLNGEATRHSVAMGTELAADLPTITADRVQLQQVFMNLMLNAIEAMKDSSGELTVKSQLQDGQLQFSVSDTGVGLPTEGADQMFSAFFTTKPQGSGMGLAISRSIVESHGGRLWATANDGRGATFHFTLPIQVTESSPLVA
jgi:PAS domain S-box-containing protein